MPSARQIGPAKRLQLVNAPLAETLCPGIRAGAYPPLHLACLAAFLTQSCPQIEIEIIDGELCGVEEVIRRLNAEVVGISCNSLTYEAALRISEAAKRKGSWVVLGGAHPTFAGRQIIRNRQAVDAAVYADGELALLGLVTGRKLSDIPNLIYRDGERVCATQEFKLALDELPAPDYGDIPLEAYFRNYRNLYPDKPFRRPFAAYSAKGCQWRDRSGGGCVFCAIQHLGFRIKPVRQFWEELRWTHDAWGADFFWDVSDTFTMQRQWVREFASQKPQQADFHFQVYARAPDIDDEMARLLSRIGVYEVFLGLESGSNETLKASRKGATVRSNLQAIRNLKSNGVKAVVSIIIGLPGESEETLAATMCMAEDLLSWGHLSEINCSIFLPLPGSQSMTLLNERLPPTDGKEDLFDAEALRSAWVARFCKVSYERLIEVQGQMRRLHARVGTFGLTVSEQATQVTLEQATSSTTATVS
jgi:anaerobic magnesium-protoporphyrin IX monomethyl ester cyclase